MNCRTIIDSTLDVYVYSNPNPWTTCIYWPKLMEKRLRKRRFTPARVKLMASDQAMHWKFALQIAWLCNQKEQLCVPVLETTILTRWAKYFLCVRTESTKIAFIAQSETECQRWASCILDCIASSSTNSRRSKRFSLCLSNFKFSIIHTRMAVEFGLDQFEYWAVLDLDVGLTLFPASSGNEKSKSITFQMENIAHVKLADVENPMDVGKILDIGLKLDVKMTKKWRHKKTMTPTAILGFHTLSLFCADAQKFVDEWNCDKKSMPNSRLDSDRLSSSSSSRSTSHSNLSTFNSLLRRSLPALSNFQCTPTTPSPKSINPPPLPSRKELEQRENDRLVQRNQKFDFDPEKASGQYKLLPVDAVLVKSGLDSPPPLPPKSLDLGRRTKSTDTQAHYKILPSIDQFDHRDQYDHSHVPPPLPPRRTVRTSTDEDRSSNMNGYKTLNSLETKNWHVYNFLPNPMPLTQGRRSLETEV